ncbi:Fibronectin-binding protein A N-terminus (FbpA) family protein [Acanthocheilonema viteae]
MINIQKKFGGSSSENEFMKNRFSTLDVFAVVHDLKELTGQRVVNVYDVDPKTYLIRIQKSDEKCFIMLESGCRIHKTTFDWPKVQFPSSFTMKLRKHIRHKRLECVTQLGVDRIVDMQFGFDEHAYHVIVELYDRGNVLLTDNNYTILNVLRPRTDKETDTRFSVQQRYPLEAVRQDISCPTKDELMERFRKAKKGDSVKRFLAPLTQYGPTLIEHSLRMAGVAQNAQIGVNISMEESGATELLKVLQLAHQIFNSVRHNATQGFLIYKENLRMDGVIVETYQEFHPFMFAQFTEMQAKHFDSFSECVDEFFSKLELQKASVKALNAEKEAMKKLNNVIKDQQDRIAALKVAQVEREEMAELIELNSDLVDKALLVIRSAIANQLSWEAIEEMRMNACEAGNPIAASIVGLNLNSNEMTLLLRNPYCLEIDPKKVTIDIALSSYQNARKLHAEKKAAEQKQQKTISASSKALKSAKMKTKETLEVVHTKTEVMKKRRVMWFEKFFWFVSSENYLVIGGRDAQQNELLVKRYLRPGDIYMHADARGASSIIIRNKLGGGEIPPRTLSEAATMAICYSSAWEAKVTTSAWWVHQHQVSRTAPTGEYLTPGSFMIRGKKNYLPTCQLQMGFGIMFQLDEQSLERHIEERKTAVTAAAEDDTVNQDDDDEISLNGREEERNSDTQIDDFPDVQVSLQGIISKGKSADEGDNYTIIQVGPTVQRKPAIKTTSNIQDNDRTQEVNELKENGKVRPMTRRQKHKAEKIKKKYGDQDDEERQLRLMLLASKPKDTRNFEKKTINEKQLEKVKKKNVKKSKTWNQFEHEENASMIEEKAEPPTRPNEEEDDELLEADMAIMDTEETKILNSLTWRPLDGDVLLFALVIVAPYQTMHNFKYKVKLTPGTGKRGKAAKSAIALFQRDKSANAQELNLLKVLATDDQISRNIPGKMDTEVKEEGSGSQVPPSKRFRRDDNVDPTNPDPSIVVHVRNLSPKATEADLLEALSHFGPISYATCMPGKRMALVEFEEVEGARSCVVYAQTNQIYVAGQAALFNYSTSKMIQRLGLESETPNHVLILTIYNAQYPINVDVIHEICESHGFVKRIAMIRRTMLQALVEFESVEIAKKAKHAMNGADIYTGCCTLKVEFAKPEHVKVTRNDMDQWDYTKAPQSEYTEEPRKTLLNDAGPRGGPPGPRGPPSYGGYGGRGRGGPPGDYGYHDDRYGGGYGRGRGNYDEYDGGYGRTEGYGRGDGYSRGDGYYGRGGGRGGFGRGDGTYNRGGYARGRGSGAGLYEDERDYYNGDGPVMMIYGIDQDNFNCDKLFNLLCLYGNCNKIKFMKSKTDTAMAQMGSVRQVYTTIDNLHGTMIFGNKLALRPSKQQILHEIRDPFILPDGTPSYRDYTNSRNQRYTTPELAARNRIVKPTHVLHWYNAPVTMTEEKLKDLFVDKGAVTPDKVVIFPQRSERSSAGICEFSNMGRATEALMLANHTPVESPVGKAPYIVKLAFAGGRDGKDFRM